MAELKIYDNLHIQINSDNREFLYKVKDYFTSYVAGYRFMPAYESGHWDGKTCLFNSGNRTIPYGLFADFMNCAKKYNEEVKITKEVAQLFSCIKEPKPVYNLSLKPREYQEDCILASLKYGRGIIRVATAGGKSLIISYIIKELVKKKIIKKILIIVPTVSLCEQMYEDMKNYGLDILSDVIYSGSDKAKKIKITFDDGSVKLYNENDKIQTKRGKILAKNIKETDTIL